MTIKLWPFRPDWEGGVLEKLEWLTDVMGSTKGAEQRRPQRLTPRKTMEVTFLPHGRGRTVFDLYVSKLGNEDWYVPLWYDVDALRQATTSDSTELLTEVAYREFTLNGLAVIRTTPSGDHEATTFAFEIVKVVGRTTRSLLVERGQEGTIAREWGRGSEIYPLRKARFTNQPSASVVTAGIYSVNMSFTVTEPNEWEGGSMSGYGQAYSQSWSVHTEVAPLTPKSNLGVVFTPEHLPLFEGFRVLTIVPDYNQDMTMTYDRVLNLLDNDNGIPLNTDTLGFGVPTQKHTWFISGREDLAKLRTLLYWLRGKVRPLWVPTFNDDVQLIAPAASGAAYIDIVDIGYGELGGGINRQVLAINLQDGSWIFRRITGSAAGDGFERLELSAVMPRAVAINDVYKISFMAVNRLAQDTVELNHETDSKGLTTLSTTFRASPDLRQYLPWEPKQVFSPQMCDKTCAGMPRVDEWLNYGLADFSWSVTDAAATAKAMYLQYRLAYSQMWVPWYDTEITDNTAMAADDVSRRAAWTAASGSVYNQAADEAFYNAQIIAYGLHSRAVATNWMSTYFPERLGLVEDLGDSAFKEYYLKLRFLFDYNIYGVQTDRLLMYHPRRWLPMVKLEGVPATCANGMLGKFCAQTTLSVDPLAKYPTQLRGASTLYTAGVVERLLGVDEVTWPTGLDTNFGLAYRQQAVGLNGNNMFSNCGCVPLQFQEVHLGIRPQVANPEDDPAWVQWFHWAQFALLTPSAWPEEIQMLVYDSISGVLLRTYDLTITNYSVTAKADEFQAASGGAANYTANLVVFRAMYNGEADGQTTYHADPWEGQWNIMPVNTDGVFIEIYAR